MIPRTEKLLAWIEEVKNSGLDLGAVRAARADFEAIAGPQNLGEMCGDFVRVMPEEKPAKVPLHEALAMLVREGMHRFTFDAPKKPRPKEKNPEIVAIGMRIREARIRAGFGTQIQLADHLGFHRTSLNTFEAGFTRPSPEKLQKLSTALGVSAEWLKTGQGQPFAQAA